jgi:hypothetical protein
LYYIVAKHMVYCNLDKNYLKSHHGENWFFYK